MELKKIKRVQVVSFALTIGAIYALFGFIVGILFAVLGGSILAGLLGMAGGSIPARALGGLGALSVLAIIIFPIIYFILGFIGSAIAAILYNVVAPRVGGIQVELE